MAGGGARGSSVLAVVGVTLLTLLVVLPLRDAASPKAILVLNSGPEPVLIDARWWGGPTGLDGSIAALVEPESTAVMFRAGSRSDICVRVIEPRSGRVRAGLVTGDSQNGDTVQVTVGGTHGGSPHLQLTDPCPPRLENDRVRVALGRYFEPGAPDRIRRERVINRY